MTLKKEDRSKRTIGANIEYTCPDGYMLVGSKNRICESTGFWSENPPNCKCKKKIINSSQVFKKIAFNY